MTEQQLPPILQDWIARIGSKTTSPSEKYNLHRMLLIARNQIDKALDAYHRERDRNRQVRRTA
jgi:hypothetical protein